MLRVRIIPCLQLINQSLVKTVQFSRYNYIGDPINTVRIFNELEVDELCFLDIRASSLRCQPNLKILKDIADECFMPLSYGGGIRDDVTAKKILSIGFEKIVINTAAYKNPSIIKQITEYSGNQSVIGSIDVKKNILGKYFVYIYDGTERIAINPVEWAQNLESLGAGELLITSMNQDGTWKGYDIEITRLISDAVSIPVIANGGAGNIDHIKRIIEVGKADAAALGSMVVYQAKGMGVLINFPDKSLIEKAVYQNS
jgi:cyclase